jgi:membrane protein YqaA with SNARE-associated domain
VLHRLAEDTLLRMVLRFAGHPAYPAVVCAAAFGATLSMTLPFATVLVVAVLAAPKRWPAVAVWSSVGTALGGLVLYLAFHHLGWAQFAERYPEIAASRAWLQASAWLSEWGLYALFAIAALPLPQTPAVAFAALARLSPLGVFAALFVGKLAKYGLYAWGTSRFPSWFLSRLHGDRAIASVLAALRGVGQDSRPPIKQDSPPSKGSHLQSRR